MDIINRIKNPVIMLLLLILPPSLMFLISMWNWLVFWVSDDLDLLIFQWTMLHYIIWFIFGISAGAFYIYQIFFKNVRLYLLGIPFQIGVFIFTWLWWITISGPLDHFDTLEIEDTTYHLIQTSAHMTDLLHMFTCEEFCSVRSISKAEYSKYNSGNMSYNPATHSIHIIATGDNGIDEYTIPVSEN